MNNKKRWLAPVLILLAASAMAGGDEGDCNGYGNCKKTEIEGGKGVGYGGDGGDGGHSYSSSSGGAGGDGGHAGAKAGVNTGDLGPVDVGVDADLSTGAATATNAGVSTSTQTNLGDTMVGLEIGGPTTHIKNLEAVRVAPAFGTACYESMNASLLDKGVSIGSANVICQSLQMVDVWFALAAVTEDPEKAAEYTQEGIKLLKKSTKMLHRKLAWHNVKGFFQEVGVPVGLVVLLL